MTEKLNRPARRDAAADRSLDRLRLSVEAVPGPRAPRTSASRKFSASSESGRKRRGVETLLRRMSVVAGHPCAHASFTDRAGAGALCGKRSCCRTVRSAREDAQPVDNGVGEPDTAGAAHPRRR